MSVGAAEDRGRLLGRYEIIAELGHGGMAVVYRARDTQLLRDVAVKVLHPHLANEAESRQRFLREAQAAARLRHPNIVEVFDFSVESDRESYMVTELLEGPTLRKFVESRMPLPAEVVAAIGVVLCDALDCAHAQGVVHRDVKPDNIMLHKGGSLKLTDFGIAHVADGNGMTITGQILGSPAHMAPEQIEGTSVDARTDLFSLGTVLYLLSVGRLPFEAPVAHALLRKILEADYTDPLRAQPLVGHRFAEIVRKCMARMPEDRYPNAKALRQELSNFCLEIGWEDPPEQLKEYIADPESFADRHRAVLLETLPVLGERAQKQKRVQDALGYFNRALAIEPSNTKVLKLVRGVALRRRRERTLRASAIVAASAVVSASVGGVALAMWRQHTLRAHLQVQPETGHATVADAGINVVHSASTPVVAAVVDAGVTVERLVETSATVDAALLVARVEDAGVPVRMAIAATAIRSTANARIVGNPQAMRVEREEPRRVRLQISTGVAFNYRFDPAAVPVPMQGPFEVSLPPGAHRVELVPNNTNCLTQYFSFSVPSRRHVAEVPGVPFQIRAPGRFNCGAPNADRDTTALTP